MATFFIELSLVTLLAFGIALVLHKIRQPLIIAYIFTGILAGPLFLNILVSRGGYESFSHIGVAFLLFIVGLHLDARLIKDVGKASLITGIGQIVFTTIFGFGITYLLGYPLITSLIIAIGLTFSSTIIIIKLLSDKKALNTLYGKISLGFLLVQDFVAALILLALGTFISLGSQDSSTVLLQTLRFIIIASGSIFILARYGIPRLLKHIAHSTELMFIFVIAWCFTLASVFQMAGFSLEIGALIAGIALGSSRYQHEISSRVKPLRDFFLIIFFIFLGYELLPQTTTVLANLSFVERFTILLHSFEPFIGKALILSLFVLIGNPLIVLILMLRMGYSSKTGFLSGLAVSQISEFSIIIALVGKEAGLLGSEVVSLLTLVAIITIICSTYLFMYGEHIYAFFEPVLRKFERKRVIDKAHSVPTKPHDVLLFGVNRTGKLLLPVLRKKARHFLAIDYDPTIVQELKKKKIPIIYGDASNIEFLSLFEFKNLKLVVSTLSEYKTNALLVKEIQDVNPDATIIVTAENAEDVLSLYKQGADYVIFPHFLGGNHVGTLLEEFNDDPERIIRERINHLKTLKKKKRHLQ